MPDLFFDADFRAIIPPLSKEEYDGLDKSIAEHGNIVPVVVWKETGLLLDGHNRYDLCHKHGKELKQPIEMSFPDRDAAMLWMIDNQLSRRNIEPFTRIELALLKDGLQIVEQNKTKEYSGKKLDPTQILVEGDNRSDRESDSRIGAIAGVSRETVRKQKIIKQKASPELLEKVKKGEKTINQAFVMVRREEVKEQNKEAQWPDGKYRVIYADPPWAYNNHQADTFIEQSDHYGTYTPSEIIARFPVQTLALDNSVLFLWVTSPLLEEAFDVINAWGFSYKTSFVWDKVKHVMGHYNSVRHEFLLLAVKGSCPPDNPQLFDSVFTIERTGHSEKPCEYRQMIEALYPYGPKIELFAREKHDGWEVYGNQICASISE